MLSVKLSLREVGDEFFRRSFVRTFAFARGGSVALLSCFLSSTASSVSQSSKPLCSSLAISKGSRKIVTERLAREEKNRTKRFLSHPTTPLAYHTSSQAETYTLYRLNRQTRLRRENETSSRISSQTPVFSKLLRSPQLCRHISK